MNRSLAFILSFSLGFAAFGLACSDETSSDSAVDDTTPAGHDGSDVTDETDAGSRAPTKKDAGDDGKKDAGDDTKKDAGDQMPDGPLTKAQVQALLDSRCTTCHTGTHRAA